MNQPETVGKPLTRRANAFEYGPLGVPLLDFNFEDPSRGTRNIAAGYPGVLKDNKIGLQITYPIVKDGKAHFNGIFGYTAHVNAGEFIDSAAITKRTYLIQLLIRPGGAAFFQVPWSNSVGLSTGFIFALTSNPASFDLSFFHSDIGGGGAAIFGLQYNKVHTIIAIANGRETAILNQEFNGGAFLASRTYFPTGRPLAYMGDLAGGGFNVNGKIYRCMFWDKASDIHQARYLFHILEKRR